MKIFKEKIKHKSRLLTDKLLLLLLKGWIKRKFYVRYINLDERKDRKKHIETLLGRFNVNFKRINATKFKSTNGATEEEITIFKRGVESYLISEEFHKNRFNGVRGEVVITHSHRKPRFFETSKSIYDELYYSHYIYRG